MAFSMVPIVSTLTLFFMMMAEMGDAQSLICAGTKAVPIFWDYFRGLCYIQATTTEICTCGAPAPYVCGTFIIFPTSNSYRGVGGTFSISVQDTKGNIYGPFNGTYAPANDTLQPYLVSKSDPPAQVLALGEGGRTVVLSIVYANPYGYLLARCAMSKENTITRIELAFICTYNQTVTPDIMKQFKTEVGKTGIDPRSMVDIPQTNCK